MPAVAERQATAAAPPAGRAGARPLGLHEGISHPEVTGCPRWPERLRLRSSLGELVKGRCRGTNLCAYCARLNAVENSELLQLDALEGTAPAIWACLGTRAATLDTRCFYKSRELVMRALKRRWPDVQYAALVEFTTGYGKSSGGQRRPHWNLLLKGIPVEDLEDAREVILRVWCAREDAEPYAQHVGLVSEAGGLMRYIAHHFQKESQRPPEGWRGHRFIASRGYLWTDTPTARKAARESLANKRELWRALNAGKSPDEAERQVAAAAQLRAETDWQLVDVSFQLVHKWREYDEARRLARALDLRAGPSG